MIGASVALALAFVWHARNADEPFLPLPLLGGTVVPYAMAAGGFALGAIIGLTVHPAALLRGGLPFQRQRGRACADSARRGLDLRRGDRRPDHGARQHYKRVADGRNVCCAALCGVVLTLTTLPLWGLLMLLSLFALGLGTTFPVSVVSLQNSVARPQIGTVTGAMNFFRALMSSFMVAAFSAILLMALGADISLAANIAAP